MLRSPLVPALLMAACARVDGTVELLNGTSPGDVPEVARVQAPGPAAVAEPGRWALTPSRASTRLRYVSFQGDGLTPSSTTPLDDCVARYDRSLGSLEPVGSCELTVAVGSYASVRVGYTTTFELVVDDAEAGIWSDPTAPGGLTTTEPDGGAQPIEALDPNTDPDEAEVEVFFTEPLTVREGDTPVVSLVFDPTHWMKTQLGPSGFSEPLASGNPPLMPTVGDLGKAAYYTAQNPAGSYRMDTCEGNGCMSLLFLYRDADTPFSVTWQDTHPCPSLDGWSPVASFAGDTDRWGAFGRLGLDDAGILAWVSAEDTVGGGGSITGYTGVYRMAEATATGTSVDLDYRCDANVPDPSSGDTFASGAPTFTPTGTIPMTLRY